LSHPILRKLALNEDTFRIELRAPHVAERFRAGQFVIIRLHEHGERVPLTVADVDPGAGKITLIFQAVGKTTMELGGMRAGEALLNVVGPLGNPTEVDNFGRVVCMGGGTGIACIYPIVRALTGAGNRVTALIGARSEKFLILEDEMRAACADLRIATDDGSRGRHGFVTELLREVIEQSRPAGGLDRVVVIGPPVMMKAAAEITRPEAIPTVASLNTIMVDGTGMCGCCRVYIDGRMKLACIDGPEFDAHRVDFDDVIRRLDMFRRPERKAVELYKAGLEGDS
jgi:ferredoxin--NADP+ reductase